MGRRPLGFSTCHHAQRCPPMTCTPASRSPSTPVRRRSRSPGGRCCACTIPDVAGPTGLERAKRINVAHDWLSDPELRARYDHERGLRRSVRDTGGRDPRRDPGGAAPEPARTVRRRPVDPAEALARFLDRVATLEPDEIDRLACAEPPPIAFGATIARFLPEDRLAALDGDGDGRRRAARSGRGGQTGCPRRRRGLRDRAGPRRLPRRAPDRPVPRAGAGAADAGLGGGRRAAALRAERRRRAGAHRPAGGPRRGRASTALAATAGRAGLDRQPDEPWPPGTSPDDDEALRVSSILAAGDAAAAIPAA